MANTTDVYTENNLPLYLAVILGIIITSLIIIGIIGNILTVVSYIRDQQLRSVYNTYIVNLAVTDFFLCLWSMPFYAVYTLQKYSWPFGYYFCKVYMVGDFTLCLESVLIIMIISVDRLFLLHFGPYYTVKITFTKAYIQIGVSWIIAFLLYSPAIIGWDIWTGENIVEEDDCDVQFANNQTFTSTTGFIEFVIPFLCIGIVNLIIYLKIKKRNVISIHNNPSISTENTRTDKHKRDQKAARFLAALVLVFFCTWAPYTVTTVIIAFCEDCVNEDLWNFFNWLLWSKSAINPFLYAYNSTRFRQNFTYTMSCCKVIKLKENTREQQEDTVNTNS